MARDRGVLRPALGVAGARVCARARTVPGARLTPTQLTQELQLLGYKEGLDGDEPARFERRGDVIELVTRAFPFWDGAQPARALRLAFRGGRVETLHERGNDFPVDLARLDPLPIGGIYPAHNQDRVLVKFDEVPRDLVNALLAIEDRQFYSHIGVDPRGVARAAVATLSGKGVQGGSTLTQQLVKNFYLTPERTLKRKVTEMVMALLLELHYDKQEILEAYVNEIYLGQDRNRAIHGFGLAAFHYFGRPLPRLTLAEAALLVGMVKGPALYDPHRHPQRALERRNLVLAEMRELGYISPEQFLRAKATSLGVAEKRRRGYLAAPGVSGSRAPATAAGLRRVRPAFRGPENLHHARSARAARRGAGVGDAPGKPRRRAQGARRRSKARSWSPAPGTARSRRWSVAATCATKASTARSTRTGPWVRC